MSRPPTLLVAINARYSHASLAVRYLAASLERAGLPWRILEFTHHQSAAEIVESIIAARGAAVCFSVYVWNAVRVEEAVEQLRETAPELPVILGGPEVSYETDSQRLCRLADLTICGEADLLLAEVLAQGAGVRAGRAGRVVAAPLPDLGAVALPYHLYSDRDLAERNTYVETTRGCPFRCSYCLSAIQPGVRRFPLPAVLGELDRLLARGARRIKFVDRTFNSDIPRALRILRFLLPRIRPPVQVHLEMVPDRFPRELLELAAEFPPGCLRFEIGIQTWNPAVAANVQRFTRYERVEENLEFILRRTGVEVHADLLAGLPGEDLQMFGEGFDRLLRIGPHEIQVGLLKRLRGAPINRAPREWEMEFEVHPPYALQRNRWLSEQDVQLLVHFGRLWDRMYNRRRLPRTMELFRRRSRRPFQDFAAFTHRVVAKFGRSHSIALDDLAWEAIGWLTETVGVSREEARASVAADYAAGGRRVPRRLRTAAAGGSQIGFPLERGLAGG